MTTPILRITDGTTTINLLGMRGWLLQDWEPSVPAPKGGGVFRDSPLADGRKLVFRKMENIIDTFNLVVSGDSQNLTIQSVRELQTLLEKAASYWTSDWQNEPVWIEAKGPCEDNIRYATIVDYRLTGFGSPYRQPFFNSVGNVASEAILVVEHQFWQATVPGEAGDCIKLKNKTDYPSVAQIFSGQFAPSASAHDATYSDAMSTVDLAGNVLSHGYDDSNFPGNSETGIIFDNVTIPAGSTVM